MTTHSNAAQSFSILRPVVTSVPPENSVRILSDGDLSALNELDELIAVDIETNGTQVHNPNTVVVGVGLADHSRIFYVPTTNREVYEELLEFLQTRQLMGFNIYFDAAFLHRDSHQFFGTGLVGPKQEWLNWKWDCYGLYKQLASEGWMGQTWNLKDAQRHLLGWRTAGDWGIRKWLVENGYYTDTKLKEPEVNTKDYILLEDGKWHKADKSKMHLAPVETLGYYCGLDAASTYSLFSEVFIPSLKQLTPMAQENFQWYHQELFWTTIKWHIEQQLRGITIDTAKLTKHAEQLLQDIVNTEKQFLEHPTVAPFVAEWNAIQVAKERSRQPAQYKKDGTVSKNWLKWRERVSAAENTNFFNIQSGPQKCWLFYEKLGYPIIVRTEKKTPAADKKALINWGELGELLRNNNDASKELGYVRKCLEIASSGTLHPQFNMCGTLTGRLAGSSGFNLQQQPKSKEYFECIGPPEGMTWIDCDVQALEAVVLAELSKDETMNYLYSPDSPKQDLYLFVGSHLPGIGKTIRAAGYDPERPTAEAIARAKKEAKQARQVAKGCALGFQYNMGPKKLRQTLALQGYKISDNEAFEIYKAYWNLFSGIKRYARWLEDQWRSRGGWVYNGIGRPVGCYQDYLQDITNRVIQSTGHDILMFINWRLYQLREETDLDFYPVIIDWHDATTVECPQKNAPQVVELFEQVYREVNEWLGGELPIKGQPQVVENLAVAKCE